MVNDDFWVAWSLAALVSGAKLAVVLGHTARGALKGAIYDVMLRNLTGVLSRIGSAAEPCLALTSHPVELSFC